MMLLATMMGESVPVISFEIPDANGVPQSEGLGASVGVSFYGSQGGDSGGLWTVETSDGLGDHSGAYISPRTLLQIAQLANYEIRCDVISGDTPAGSSVGERLSLDVERHVWGYSVGQGEDAEGTLQFRIRLGSETLHTDQATFGASA